MQVYLCARVAPEAHELTARIAKALRARGLTVFVPYEEDLDDPEHKKAPFAKDFSMMLKARVCIAVGRLGVDCATEIGWFTAYNVPIVRVAHENDALSPMLAGMLQLAPHFRADEPNLAADAVATLVREEVQW